MTEERKKIAQNVGLDLTKHNIKKFKEFNIKESKINNIAYDKLAQNTTDLIIGLDLVNYKSGYKIDLTKYGEDIN